MNSNTCPPGHGPSPLADSRPPKASAVVGNKIYSNYTVKQTSSGSETDVSTSTENLTPEEHYVLKTGIRQEPQGEETYLDMSATSDGLPFSSTLVVHENGALNNFNYMPPYLFGNLANNIYAEVKDQMPKNDNFFYHNHSISEQPNVSTSVGDKPEMVKNNLVSVIDNDSHYSNLNLIKFGQASVPNNQLFLDNESVINLQSTSEQSKIASPDASSLSLQQPMLNNYLNSLKKKDSLMIKNFNADNLSLPPPPPPPEYEKWNAFQISQISPNASKSCERLAISRSHPDLSKFADEELNNPANRNNTTFFPNVHTYGYSQNSFQRNSTIEMLLSDNSSLRAQLDLCVRRVKKLQNFELEIQKVHQSHEELMMSSEKKEKLERALRYKLDIQVRRLQEENRRIKEQLESSASKRANYNGEDIDSLELKKEINKRDILISRLLAQNKESISDKERQEIELQAQRLTLQEQRNHIEILDTALMNAQNNIITLETELRKKQEFEEKTLFLKKALSNLQLANDRRLQMEKRVRTQLEKEIEELKKQNMTEANCIEPRHNDKDLDSMKRIIREYEEKIISLEAEVSKWEQKYLEESTLRSIEVSAASAPKDAKIAALERTSQESEKMIAEARNERLKHMDEIHLANKKFTELESKLKDVESKLAEKDAMIKVLQKHSEDRDAVLQKTLVRRFPNRHTRSASTMGLVVSGPASGAAPTSADSLSADLSKLLVANTSPRPNNSLVLNADCADANIDEHLREMDSRLSPKDSIIKALRSEKERHPENFWRI